MANLYGRTIAAGDLWARATTDDARILIDWCINTLSTKPGTVKRAPEHGFLRPDLAAGLTTTQRAAIEANAKAALERGRKVASATVSASVTNLGGGRMAVALRCEVKPSTGGPAVTFTHTVDATLAADIIRGT
jgi:hypothetical protein